MFIYVCYFLSIASRLAFVLGCLLLNVSGCLFLVPCLLLSIVGALCLVKHF